MLEENIRIVEDGGDPKNTFRDPAANVYLGMATEDSRRAYRQGRTSLSNATNKRDTRRDDRFGGLATVISTKID